MGEVTCQRRYIHGSGEAYQDQAFNTDTTGFIVRLVVGRGGTAQVQWLDGGARMSNDLEVLGQDLDLIIQKP
jgi:hypothetical protein